MPTHDDEVITLHRLTEVRVCTVHDQPERVILKVTSAGHVTHYSLHRDDFKALARRLSLDAALF